MTSKETSRIRFDAAELQLKDSAQQQREELEFLARQLREGAEIPPGGRHLLADMLEAIAAGKTLRMSRRRGPKPKPRTWWIAAEYTVHRLRGDLDYTAIHLTKTSWGLRDSEIHRVRALYYKEIRKHLEASYDDTCKRVEKEEIKPPSKHEFMTAFLEQVIAPKRSIGRQTKK